MRMADRESKTQVMQINSETDFVARNEQFMGLVSAAAQAALRSDAGMILFSGSDDESFIKAKRLSVCDGKAMNIMAAKQCF